MRVHLARNGGIAFILVVLAAAVVLMGEQAPVAPHYRVPLVQDWTHRHMVYSAPRSILENLQIQQQPRYVQQFLRRNVAARGPVGPPVFDPVSILRRGTRQIQRDWGVVLPAVATQGAGEFPAQYLWNVNASPDCTKDFLTLTTHLAGTVATTVDIFALNNLYITGTSGLCYNSPTVTAPTVLWAFHANVNAAGAPNSSPVLSLAGDQVAWIEGGAGNGTGAVLHILRPGTGSQGTLATPINTSTLGATDYTATPATYVTCKGTAGQTCELHMTFGNTRDDTTSQPYYDYTLDAIFVGDAAGNLHEFTNVFKGTPAEATTGNWPILMNGGGSALGSPVYDETSQNVFVGNTAGNFRAAILKTGTCNTGTIPCRGSQSYAVGTSVTEAPIVDSTTEKVFVFGQAAGGAVVGEANAGVVGATQPLQTKQAVVNVGTGTTNHLYSGDFDNNYYTSDTSLATASGFLYVCGNNGAGNAAEIQRITITAGLLVSPVNATHYVATTGVSACSPVTEFLNTSTSIEYVFFSVAGANAAYTAGCGTAHSCVLAMTVTGGTFTTTPSAGLAESGGTSGIVIDNSAVLGGASVYFTPLSNASATYPCGTTTTAVGCAVKATQSGLN